MRKPSSGRETTPRDRTRKAATGTGKRPRRGVPGAAPHGGAPVRLQKYLAHAGVASRRAAEALIREGKVAVDGRVVREPGTSVDPRASVVKVSGRVVRPPAGHTYLMLNKPRRVICTLSDPGGRRTVRDLLPRGTARVYPVGRLDWDAEGVLLLTDDGDLAARLMHPRHGVERTYHVKVRGKAEPAELAALERGVRLEDGRAAAENVRFLRPARENSWIALTLREGRHHEVKRMCAAVGRPVAKLRRVSYAGLGLGQLPLGAVRALSAAEVAALRRAAGSGGGEAGA